MKKPTHNIMRPTRKTFQNGEGKWIEKPTRTEILLCSCGSRYIQTRADQRACVRCLSHPARK